MLTDTELEGMRAVIASTFTDTIQVAYVTKTVNAMGHPVKETYTVGSPFNVTHPVKCSQFKLSDATINVFADRIKNRPTSGFRMPYNTTIKTGDSIVASDGTYTVFSVSGESTLNLSKTVLAVKQ